MDKFLKSVSERDFDRRISEVVEMLEEKQLYGTISLIKDLKYYLDLATKEKAHTCDFQHNSNSRDNEHCCGCDSKVSENDDTKNKVTSLEIIVRTIDNKPYYEIKYKKVGEDYYHVGYSSFNIDNVLKWRDECFELVDAKATRVVIQALEEVQQYRAIGTPKECRAAAVKQTAKKPIFNHNLSDTLSVFHCECGNKIKVSHNIGIMNNNNAPNYCSNCGCKFDWGDEE